MSYVRYVEELDLYSITAEPTEFIINNSGNLNHSVDYLLIIIIILITIKFY
jgi:hypothetical protein